MQDTRVIAFDSADPGAVTYMGMETIKDVTTTVATTTQNPITRSVVKLDPPLPVADLGTFRARFAQFCDDAWMLPTRRDPQRVNPHRVIDGTEPVDVLNDTVARLVAEHGPWAVSAAVAKLMPEH